MRMALLRMRAAALAALAWGSACGGNVVVDGMPDGSGGAGVTSSSAISTGAFGSSAVSVGGSSAISTGVGGSTSVTVGGGGFTAVSSSATWMATSGTASASTGAGGGDAWSSCMKFCETYSDACEQVEPGQCEGFCKGYVNEAPQCNERLAMFFECATNASIDCDFVPQRCQPFLAEYDACRDSSGCTPLECFADRNRTCSCKGSCRNAGFAVECRPDMRNGIVCSCFVNGEELATCQDVGPACDLAHGCCEPIFDDFR
ncbi:hypothetical protein WMF45_29370 [Sorangium sp. So ce448]|uniref:hypothetical protein n=1 Tax=Sorangium sp. So ce448 TaxID=3133314 RepID=UPI003F6163AE